MGAPVVHWEINARNGSALQEFYSSLFGWKISANNPMKYGMVDTKSKKGVMGGIAQQTEEYAVPQVTFYIEVDDLQASLDKAEKLGGTTVMPPTDIPGMVSLAMFADLEGNVLGLVKDIAQPKKVKKAVKKKVQAKKKPAAKSKAKKSRKK